MSSGRTVIGITIVAAMFALLPMAAVRDSGPDATGRMHTFAIENCALRPGSGQGLTPRLEAPK